MTIQELTFLEIDSKLDEALPNEGSLSLSIYIYIYIYKLDIYI